MKEKIQNYIVRGSVLLFVVGIFTFIFWPASKENHTDTTSSTLKTNTTQPNVKDSECLILFKKDTADLISSKQTCLDNYIEKYNKGIYSSLKLECRASSDGGQSNRKLLSDNRLKTVEIFLMENGVKKESIQSKSYGDKNPYPGLDKNSDEGKVFNRSCILSN